MNDDIKTTSLENDTLRFELRQYVSDPMDGTTLRHVAFGRERIRAALLNHARNFMDGMADYEIRLSRFADERSEPTKATKIGYTLTMVRLT